MTAAPKKVLFPKRGPDSGYANRPLPRPFFFALALPLVTLAHVAGGGNWVMSNFALQAARYFQRQDYPNLELVIVEDGDPALAARLFTMFGHRQEADAVRAESLDRELR